MLKNSEYSWEGLRAILKRTMIIVNITFVVLLIWGYMRESTTVTLFKNIDTDNISKISIFNSGASFNTDDKNEILEIMNYLKNVKLSKISDEILPNTTPDAQIALEDKDGKIVSSVAIYGYISILYPNDGEWYTIPGSIYSDLENLYKKLKNK